MNNTMTISKLNGKKKGTFFKAQFSSEVTQILAARKKEGYAVVKTTIGTFRVGINNANRKVVKEKMLSGWTPSERKWGAYMKDSDRIIEYTSPKDNIYRQYAVLYSTPNKARTTYTIIKDGKAVKTCTHAEIKKMDIIQPSYFNNEGSGVFTINLANIEHIW